MKRYLLLTCFLAAGRLCYADGTINIASPGNGTGWTFVNRVVTIADDGNYVVTGTSTANRIVINWNVRANVTLQNVNIQCAGSPFALSEGADVTLILEGSNNRLAANDTCSAGLTVEGTARVTIEGDGALLAQGGGVTTANGNGGAGIGSSSEKIAGTIVINSGTITANGGAAAAGIGGGNMWATYNTTNTIAINGGNITINGGTIRANGGVSAAGIGGGSHGSGDNITINGGVVYANSASEGAGMGGGQRGSGGNITINKGTVVATSVGGFGDPAGIGGGGYTANAGKIIILGGTVYAAAQPPGPGIGAGFQETAPGNPGEIHIFGGTVIANNIGIGAGKSKTPTYISLADANTIVLSQAINTDNFGFAKVLTGIESVIVSDSIVLGDIIADVMLRAGLTIPSGGLLNIPEGVLFDVYSKVVVNAGAIRLFGEIENGENISHTPPVGAIQPEWIQDIAGQAYTGSPLTPAFTVMSAPSGGFVLTPDVYYSATAVYSNNVNAGTATVRVLDLGNYQPVIKTFTISPKPVADDWIQYIPNQQYKDGNAIEPEVIVKDGDKTLVRNTDYTVAYSNNNYAGSAALVTITGKGNYTGTAKRSFTIIAAQVMDSWIRNNIPDYTYTGVAIEPAVVVADGTKTLSLGSDYTVEYINNVRAGRATILVTGKGYYTGTASISFTINPKPIADSWIADIPTPQIYTGYSIEPPVTVRDGTKLLTLNTDYTVTYMNNVYVGTATVTVTGKGNYTGTISRQFTIKSNQMTEAWIEKIASYLYTGSYIEPRIIVKDSSNILTEGVHYTVAYNNNLNVGTATVMVTGIGIYAGQSASKNFSIYPMPIVYNWIQDIPTQFYTGKPVEPNVTLIREGGKTLIPNTDYTVAYSNHFGVGTATVTVAGIGNYTDTVRTNFTIEADLNADNWIQTIPNQTYTGDSIKPIVTVKDGDKTLEINIDYTVEYSDNIHPGTATVTVTGIGNYAGRRDSRTFTIYPKPITNDWIENIPATIYTGYAIKPAVIVKDDAKILTQDNYTIDYSDNVDAGVAKVTITGKGDYTGTASKTFIVNSKSLTDDMIEGTAGQLYTGQPIEPVTVNDPARNVVLIKGTDYEIAYSDNTAVGTASFTVTGKGNYTGAITGTFPIAISLISIQDSWIQIIGTAGLYYTGDSIKPEVVVTGLIEGTDYTIAYSNNVNAGTATVTVTGRGSYDESASKYFTIQPKPIAGDWIQDIPAQEWTGNAVKPVPVVKDGDNILQYGTDYVTECFNNTNAGTAFITVSGRGNYTGSVSKAFIIGKLITDDMIRNNNNDLYYTGLPIEPAITVTDGSLTLTPGTDYTVKYSDNINAGTATITVTGVGSYMGSASKTFTIKPKPLDGDWLESIPNQTYTGGQVKPALVIIDGDRDLAPNLDYSAEYSNNTNVGTATVTVTGAGNYTGMFSKNFTITQKAIAAEWIQDIPDQTYTGIAIEPAVSIKDGDRTLTAGTDYRVTYRNNINEGIAYAVITGTGNYTGERTKPFNIVSGSGAMYLISVRLAVNDNVMPYITLSFTEKIAEYGTTVPLIIYIANGIEMDAPVVYANGSVLYITAFDAEQRTYTAYIPVQGSMEVIVSDLSTGREETAAAGLRSVSVNNGLLISGLTPGEELYIYNITGLLACVKKASSAEELVYLAKGVYIIRHGHLTIKANKR
ncbi:MAG: Ig-like domain-containing protein [Bacteroidales bacterium]